jgi:hypothetical protein
MTDEAMRSEEAYERQRDSKIEWGRGVSDQMNRACWWFKDAGVKLDCKPR